MLRSTAAMRGSSQCSVYFLSFFVDGRQVLNRTADQFLGELPRLIARLGLGLPKEHERIAHVVAFAQIVLIEKLNGQFTGLPAFAETFYRLFHTDAISIAVSALRGRDCIVCQGNARVLAGDYWR